MKTSFTNELWMRSFIKAMIEPAEDGCISNMELKEKFDEFCECNGLYYFCKINWYSVLSQYYPVAHVGGISYKGLHDCRGYKGIAFKNLNDDSVTSV